MEEFVDICVLRLRPIVNVPKARWTLCIFWRPHLNLWHIKADISYIVVVHLVFDILQFSFWGRRGDRRLKDSADALVDLLFK